MAQAAKAGASKLKEFDQLRTLLRNQKREDGSNLYSHLVQVVNHIVLHCPEEGLQNFEEISYLLKNKENIDINQFLVLSQNKSTQAPSNDQVKELTHKFIVEAKKFFEVSYN